MENRAFPTKLPATSSALRPGDFELGSGQSRAAARMLLEDQSALQEPGLMLRVEVMANPAPVGTRCTCRPPATGNVSICRCFMPAQITKGLQ
jgi:hypothetical protein